MVLLTSTDNPVKIERQAANDKAKSARTLASLPRHRNFVPGISQYISQASDPYAKRKSLAQEKN
jgi:hypothetical protein